MTFGEILESLTPEAEALYVDVVGAHLACERGDREFVVTRTSRGTLIIFPNRIRENRIVDSSALNDLRTFGLIRPIRTRHNSWAFDVSGESIRFHQFLRSARGAPSATHEQTARSFVNGDTFASKHPGAAHHIQEAMELVWSDRMDDQTISEIGGHLRSAVFDVVSDIVGEEVKKPEEPASRLRDWLQDRVQKREIESLVELVKVTVNHDQRLAHIRDEASHGRPLRGWDEIRRAAHLTVVVCYELSTVAR